MGSDVTYVELSDASSKVTVGLYAGMEPQELELLVRTALQHPNDVCRGFQVTHEPSSSFLSNRYKKRSSSVIPRLVPLSVACQVPHVLIGHVSVLFMPSATSEVPKKETEQLQQLVQSFENDHQSALLRPFYDEQLLQLKKTSTSNKNQLNDLETTKKVLYMELLAKKVVSIGMKSCNLQIQVQILALADEIRQNCKFQVMNHTKFIETMKLLTIIEQLLDKHMISEEKCANLLKLIIDEDKNLWNLLQNYKNDENNILDLHTITKRLSAIKCDPIKTIPIKKNKGKSPRKGLKQNNLQVKKRVKNTFGTSEVDIVTSLHTQHLLTSLELDILIALIDQEDFQVLEILQYFKQNNPQDVKKLRDLLVNIVEEITLELGDDEKAAAAFARGINDAVHEKNYLKENNENYDFFEWQRHLNFLLKQWQIQDRLTSDDVKLLRLMVNQQHNLLESAYEVFAGDNDVNELLDTLQRVAKLQRQIGRKNAPACGLNLEDVVREMQHRGVLQSGDAAGLLVLFHGENEALQAANEAFHADGDVHELEDTLLLVVKHARFGREIEEDQVVDEMQTVCQKLLADFGKSERLELWQIQLLISLLKAHDPRLLAAVDVYYENQDTTELADTLEILVELTAWERHRRAMVVDWIPPLARSGKLSRDRAERLVQMVKARDDRIVAALVVFLSDNNKEEFVDTLVRIASLEPMKLTDAEADEMKEGHLVLASSNELEEKGVISVEKHEQTEEVEPRKSAEMDVLAATDDAENFVDTADWDLVKVNDQVEDGVMGENVELEEVKSSPKAAVSSLDADLAANKQESRETLDGDSKDDESDAQFPEESHGDITAGAEVKEERGPNERTKQHETEQSNEIERKEGQEEKDVEASSKKDSVADEDESTESDMKEETEIDVDVDDEVEDEQTGEQVEQEQQQ